MVADGPDQFLCNECGENVAESLRHLAESDFESSELAAKLLNS
ncbi:MAG: hypothetical protein ABEI86_04785 [Halobacteriaceae archaeon]